MRVIISLGDSGVITREALIVFSLSFRTERKLLITWQPITDAWMRNPLNTRNKAVTSHLPYHRAIPAHFPERCPPACGLANQASNTKTAAIRIKEGAVPTTQSNKDGVLQNSGSGEQFIWMLWVPARAALGPPPSPSSAPWNPSACCWQRAARRV